MPFGITASIIAVWTLKFSEASAHSSPVILTLSNYAGLRIPASRRLGMPCDGIGN